MPVLHCGDAIEVMAAIVDHIITDPPYGTTELKWDGLVDWTRYWDEAQRITKPKANHVMFAAQPFTTDLINSARKLFRYALVWPKTSVTGFLHAKLRPLRAHEDVLVFGSGGGIYNPQMRPGEAYTHHRPIERSAHYDSVRTGTTTSGGGRFPTSVLQETPRAITTSHPTEKPITIMGHLILTYSDVGQTILDPFMGSGTTGVMAMREGRRFIGSELDDAHYAVAEKRIRAAYDQPRLLAPEAEK
jgi:site-specific DNA-methyltransferase (adenine-specific)